MSTLQTCDFLLCYGHLPAGFCPAHIAINIQMPAHALVYALEWLCCLPVCIDTMSDKSNSTVFYVRLTDYPGRSPASAICTASLMTLAVPSRYTASWTSESISTSCGVSAGRHMTALVLLSFMEPRLRSRQRTETSMTSWLSTASCTAPTYSTHEHCCIAGCPDAAHCSHDSVVAMSACLRSKHEHHIESGHI